MTKGRKKKLTVISKKNYTKKELEEREKVENQAKDGFSPLQLDAPSHLKGKARHEYIRVSKELQSLPIRNLDRVIFEQYCTWYAIYRDCLSILKEEGIYMIDKNGTRDTSRKNPAISVMSEATNQIKSCASMLGLTVDSRMKLLTPEEEKKTPSIREMFQ